MVVPRLSVTTRLALVFKAPKGPSVRAQNRRFLPFQPTGNALTARSVRLHKTATQEPPRFVCVFRRSRPPIPTQADHLRPRPVERSQSRSGSGSALSPPGGSVVVEKRRNGGRLASEYASFGQVFDLLLGSHPREIASIASFTSLSPSHHRALDHSQSSGFWTRPRRTGFA